MLRFTTTSYRPGVSRAYAIDKLPIIIIIIFFIFIFIFIFFFFCLFIASLGLVKAKLQTRSRRTECGQ